MRRRSRFLLVPLSLLASLFLLEPSSGEDRPNVIVIMTDDQGYADLRAYGSAEMRTPHMDRLVNEGVCFDSFRANSCVCSPSRASLLTGRYPDRAGVPGVIRTDSKNSWGYLSPTVPLLPEELKKAGYQTALIGKWHLGLESPNLPNERGFDVFHGFLGDMMDSYVKHRRHGVNYMRRDTTPVQPKGHATDIFSDWTVDYLRERGNDPKPFFVFLAYNAPHVPIQPPEEWVAKVRAREPQLSPKRAAMVAFNEHLDAGIGRVLAALEETGLDERTVVIFTSDNGGDQAPAANNGPHRAGKGTMYEGGLKIPLAIRWPETIQGGRRSDVQALTMDLFPTVLDLAGAPAVEGIDGISLLPILIGQENELPPRDLYFVRREGGREFGGKTIHALIRWPWKLVHNRPFQPMELYHLEDDPLESRNLAEEKRKIFEDLATALRARIREGGAVPWAPVAP